jgi:hypothetical protein
MRRVLSVMASATLAHSQQIPLNSIHTTPEYLILGQGFIGSYVTELLRDSSLSFASTTRDGRNSTVKWSAGDPCSLLPLATNVLITFPVDIPSLEGIQACFHKDTRWMLLGSTRPFASPGRNDRFTTPTSDNPRVITETNLLENGGVVLNLAGLYGGRFVALFILTPSRQPKDWISRVAPTPGKLAALQNLHLIHGRDVARVVLALFTRFTQGERYIVTDRGVYDWWLVIKNISGDEDVLGWVDDAMTRDGVKELPRDKTRFTRYLDSDDLWSYLGIEPLYPFRASESADATKL